jgi:dienelactone hydrolase
MRTPTPFATVLLAAIALFGAAVHTVADDLTVLAPAAGAEAPSDLFHASLNKQAFAALDQRHAAYEKLKTPEQIADWQKARREFFLRQLGGFPDRTPLNAQVTGTIEREDYRIEKILFESRPRHHVTALLYLPKGSLPPFPGVLVPCGHSANGKAHDSYQRISILLAKNGLAALCYDPIGQGERVQLFKPDGKGAFNPTQEHTLTGIGSILLGGNTAEYEIWDGMRALDYLASRPEIDSHRLGCTGNSGGGTLTSYLMALDDRVVAAAPSCYSTTFRELLATSGPQDAEQNIFGQIGFGMDIPDYTLMRAPKPTLIDAATHDQIFSITGAWDLFREAKRLYTTMGHSDQVDLAEADAPHEFSTHLRVASVRWMRRWLLKADDRVTEIPGTPILKDEEAICSPKGQVMQIPGEESVFSLNAKIEDRLTPQRRDFWARTPKAEALQKVREVAGIRRLSDLPEPKTSRIGFIERNGYRIEKIVLESEAGVPLPALAFVPAHPAGEAYLYVNGRGKQADAGEGGPIEQLVKHNHLVLAVDLRGMGETETREKKWYGGLFGAEAGEFFTAYLLGKSLTGMRAEDILVAARFLAHYEAQDTPRKVGLVGIGHAGIAALHAAALEPELFSSTLIRETLTSWDDVVRTPEAGPQLDGLVHSALKFYDLPDLVHCVAPANISIEHPINALGEIVSSAQ